MINNQFWNLLVSFQNSKGQNAHLLTELTFRNKVARKIWIKRDLKLVNFCWLKINKDITSQNVI